MSEIETPTRPDLPHEQEGSWASLTGRLADALSKVHEHQVLTVHVVAEGDGEPPNYYVRFTNDGEQAFRAEAVSNRYLADRWKLPEKAAETMFQLGWSAPDPASNTPGSVNYHRTWSAPVPFVEVAQLAVSTLRRVYGAGSMEQLQYRYVADPGGDLELADLGLRREASERDPNQEALEELRPLVEEALRQALSTSELKYDESGDIPIQFGTAMVFVRLLGSPPRVRVFSPVLWEVTPQPGLLEVLNDINQRFEGGRVFLTDGMIIAAIDLPAPGLSQEYVRLACLQIGSLADHSDEGLADRFGGRTFFQGQVDGTPTPSVPSSPLPGYL